MIKIKQKFILLKKRKKIYSNKINQRIIKKIIEKIFFKNKIIILKNTKILIQIITNQKKKYMRFTFLKTNLNAFIISNFSNSTIVFINIFEIQITRLKL